MTNIQLVQCVECRMFRPSSSVVSDNFTCDRCVLVSTLTEKITALEERIQTLERVRESESSVISVEDSLGAAGGDSQSPTPALEPSQRGEWVTTRRHTRAAKAKAKAKASPPEHTTPALHVSNRFAPLSDSPAEKPGRTLVIGDSIMRHVKLARPLGAPAAVVRCIPGARVPDIEGNLRALGQHSFSKIVVHAGANDIRLRQSEVTKNNFKEVFKLAKAMSEVVICSGPLPMRRGDITYSRLWSLNRWMSRWCSENNVGFIDNWSTFEGKPGLLGRDGVHPTREGAALISCSIAHSLRSGLASR
uniref:SGNH hydrolase-type esterase domain-containing protein n=1 Tax=Anabas testudineus TaxID=64144 RepID=A0AAQ6IN95_ANATE